MLALSIPCRQLSKPSQNLENGTCEEESLLQAGGAKGIISYVGEILGKCTTTVEVIA